jgi:2-dehydropantoate 2-reductase
VVYTTATVEGPAAVRVTGGQKLVLGALCPDRTAAVAALAQRLRAYGIEIEVSDTIVDAVWNKVALNLATNPLSVVTGAPLGQLCSDERLEPIVSNILDEAWRVAARYNARPPMTRGYAEPGAGCRSPPHIDAGGLPQGPPAGAFGDCRCGL